MQNKSPKTCAHCRTHLPLHLLTCQVAVKGMAEGKKKEAPEPLRQLLIDLSNNTYFCGLHLNDDAKYAGFLAAAEKAEQSLIELFEQSEATRSRAEGGNTCATCSGHGSVGYPPDDYFDCPECTAARTQADAGKDRPSPPREK